MAEGFPDYDVATSCQTTGEMPLCRAQRRVALQVWIVGVKAKLFDNALNLVHHRALTSGRNSAEVFGSGLIVLHRLGLQLNCLTRRYEEIGDPGQCEEGWYIVEDSMVTLTNNPTRRRREASAISSG